MDLERQKMRVKSDESLESGPMMSV